MTLYIDNEYGVWELQTSGIPGTVQWKFLSGNNYHFYSDYERYRLKVDHFYLDELVKEFAPLNSLKDGSEYVFTDTFTPEDKVWVEQQWFSLNAADHVLGWQGGPNPHLSGTVKYKEGDRYMVTFDISVPADKMKKGIACG